MAAIVELRTRLALARMHAMPEHWAPLEDTVAYLARVCEKPADARIDAAERVVVKELPWTQTLMLLTDNTAHPRGAHRLLVEISVREVDPFVLVGDDGSERTYGEDI